MKAKILAWMAMLDARSLRERLLIFACAVAVVAGGINLAVVQPMDAKQKLLTQQLKQDQMQIVASGDEIAGKLRANSNDPDALLRARFAAVRGQIESLQKQLREQQKGLVSANKIAPLMQSLLKNYPNVSLVSVKTLPAVAINPSSEVSMAEAPVASNAAASTSASASASTSAEAPGAEKAMKEKALKAQPDSAGTATPAGPAQVIAAAVDDALVGKALPKAAASSAAVEQVPHLFKHEIEIVLQGNYLDLLAVVQEMEKSPWQLYWGKARLRTETDSDKRAEQRPISSLTLRVFTLSLDQTWLDL